MHRRGLGATLWAGGPRLHGRGEHVDPRRAARWTGLRDHQRVRRHLVAVTARRGDLRHPDPGAGCAPHWPAGQGRVPMTLAILVVGTVLAVVAARPQARPASRRVATGVL